MLIKADQSRSTPVKAVAGQSRSAMSVKAGQSLSKPVKVGHKAGQNKPGKCSKSVKIGQRVKVCAVVKNR
jgi:hypothetical protein